MRTKHHNPPDIAQPRLLSRHQFLKYKKYSKAQNIFFSPITAHSSVSPRRHSLCRRGRATPRSVCVKRKTRVKTSRSIAISSDTTTTHFYLFSLYFFLCAFVFYDLVIKQKRNHKAYISKEELGRRAHCAFSVWWPHILHKTQESAKQLFVSVPTDF